MPNLPASCASAAGEYAALHAGCGGACAVAAAAAAGRSGFPLFDAALACLRATGVLPLPLRPLVAAVWCKHLGLPWPALADELARSALLNDAATLALALQWDLGLCGGAIWAGPLAALDAASGWMWPVKSQDTERMNISA